MKRQFEGRSGLPALVTVAVLGAMAALTALPAGASAQDAGSSDTPEDPGVGGGICSCETVQDDDGRLHLCTDSYEREVCEQFSCGRGTERTRGCPSRGVQLCCEMPRQGTQSRLYDDCTHPNCESGFRDQCGDFDGTVHEGDCDVSATSEPAKKDTLCAVSRPGAPAAGAWWWLAALLAALLMRSLSPACARPGGRSGSSTAR
jgi:hypothetical protein